MTDALIAVLNMSVAASIVAVAVMLARFPLKRAPKVFSYLLWGVVFLRLICPFHFESPASLMPTNAEIIPSTVVMEPVPQIDSGITAVDEPVNRFIEQTIPAANPVASVNPVQVILSVGAVIWLLGVAVLLGYAVIGYLRLKRRVFDATLEHDNIYVTDKIPTAFVLSLLRPKIYVPASAEGAQLDHILKHERVHIRRRDYLIKPLAFLILAVHWFNPIVWLSYYLMSKDMEMSCDEAVLREAGEDIRQGYSTSLLSLYIRTSGLLNPLAFGEGSYTNIKSRIKNVLSFKQAPRWAILLCALVLVLFAVGFATNQPEQIAEAPISADVPVEEATEATTAPEPSEPVSTETEVLRTAFDLYSFGDPAGNAMTVSLALPKGWTTGPGGIYDENGGWIAGMELQPVASEEPFADLDQQHQNNSAASEFAAKELTVSGYPAKLYTLRYEARGNGEMAAGTQYSYYIQVGDTYVFLFFAPEDSSSFTEEMFTNVVSSFEAEAAPQIQAMTFPALKEAFFGTWSPDPAKQLPNQRAFSVGYGNLNFGDGGRINEWNPLHDAYIDESGDAVLEVNHGGEPYLYTVSPDQPGIMTVVSVNGETGTGLYGTFTKTAEADEATEVFGYMDILEFCSGDGAIDLRVPGLFYRNLVTLEDGSVWVRSATRGSPYPTLYVVEKSTDAITLRSLFYPEGAEFSTEVDAAAALAEYERELLFTVSKGPAGWETTEATYYE